MCLYSLENNNNNHYNVHVHGGTCTTLLLKNTTMLIREGIAEAYKIFSKIRVGAIRRIHLKRI